MTKREKLRKDLNELNARITLCKQNRKQDKIINFVKTHPEWFKNRTYSSETALKYTLDRWSSEARHKTVLSGLLNGTPYEKIETNPRDPFKKSFLEHMIKIYEDQPDE